MKRHASIPILAAIILLANGCAGIRLTKYVNPDFNFAYVTRVAVLPFENQAKDQQAGVRATRFFVTELLSTGATDVVEPGELRAAMNRILTGTGAPSTEQVIALGKALQVQALIIGSVNESSETRSGTVTIPVVTIDVHMVEVETGTSVWAATHTEKGAGFGARFFGTGSEPISETTRRCVKQLVKELVR